MGLDLITMAATTSKLESSGQIGSGEPSKTYVWDGNQEDKVYVPYTGGVGFAKVSDDMPDLHKFERINTVNGIYLPEDVANGEIFIGEGTAENGLLFGARGCFLSVGSGPFAVVITDTYNSPIPSTGLYFLCQGTEPEYLLPATSELVIGGNARAANSEYVSNVIDLDSYRAMVYTDGSGRLTTIGGAIPDLVEAIALAGGSGGKKSYVYYDSGSEEMCPVYQMLQRAINSPPLKVKFNFNGLLVEVEGVTIIRSGNIVKYMGLYFPAVCTNLNNRVLDVNIIIAIDEIRNRYCILADANTLWFIE